jgi:hypothetical protein
MGQVACKCGDIDIFFPWPTLAAVIGAFVMIGIGLFEKQGEPNGALIIPGFFLLFAVLGIQVRAKNNSYSDPHDTRERTVQRMPANVQVVGTPDARLAQYAVQYVTAAGLSLPVVSVVHGVPVVGYEQRLAAL